MEEKSLVNNNEDKENINEFENIEQINNTSNDMIISQVQIFKDKIKNGGEVDITDFYLYKKIKINNQISPLIIFILENAINKFNKKGDINTGFENAGFGYFPVITNQEKDHNLLYFNSENAYVFYATFSENFIGSFWSNHQLLADLLGVNPNKSVLSSNLNLGKNNLSENKPNKSNNSKNKNSSKLSSNSNSVKNDDEIRNQKNNKEYYKLSFGANFQYNDLHFLLYGVKEYINLPRIIFYPVVKYKDYEEIDSCFLVKEMKTNLETYYSNFISIYLELDDYDGERKPFILMKNDLVFIETKFEINSNERDDQILKFLAKIISFIYLYNNTSSIENIEQYTIKPIILYNKDYYLNNKSVIKEEIKKMKEIVKKYKNQKLEEIYKNLQIIYCWPTVPLFYNVTTVYDLNKEIEESKEEIQALKIKTNDLENKIKNLLKNNKNYNNNNYEYKTYYRNNYHKKKNKNNYHNFNYNSKYNLKNKRMNNKYINNINNANKKYYKNNNYYYYNDYYYY